MYILAMDWFLDACARFAGYFSLVQKYAWRACVGRVSVSLLTPYFLCTIVALLSVSTPVYACVPLCAEHRSRIVFCVVL